MQSFKEFFNETDSLPGDSPRDQPPELKPRVAKMKSRQLIQLRKQIARHRAHAESGNRTLSPEDVERLKHMVSKTAGELEGSRLPPEAEGAARDAYRDLIAMGESVLDTSMKKILIESSEIIRRLLNN